jgi:hypothetical protein
MPLTAQVKAWTTPQAQDSKHSGTNPSPNGKRDLLVNQAGKAWRTPSASDGEGGVMEMREAEAGKYKLRDHVADGVKTAKLNPRWVETLMGVPIGWTMPSCTSPLTIAPTNCDSLETESCQPQQSELF